MSDLHVIFGTGPAGTWTARALVDAGQRVRAVNRSGERSEFMPDEVEVVRVADASDPAQATEAAAGAAVVYQCLNPPYHQWHQLFPGLQRGAMAAARAAGEIVLPRAPAARPGDPAASPHRIVPQGPGAAHGPGPPH